jgi:steroid 5-alpha reductase family enzyme
MTASAWLLFLIGAASASVMMVALWALAVRIGDASHVDVGWAYGIGGVALLYAVLADGSTGHRVLVALLAGLWSIRLGTYLLVNRIIGKPEDGRYQELRRRWAPHANRAFFVFFQAQAAFVAVFSLPFLFVALDEGSISVLAWAGAALALVSIALVSLADRQLASWRGRPANKGKTCRAGLWSWSRHPNYFFEWLHWVAWAVIAITAPYGWIAIVVPAFLLALLFKVTGIPETEAQSLRSRGDDYRRYQREVSVFVPRPPRRTGPNA